MICVILLGQTCKIIWKMHKMIINARLPFFPCCKTSFGPSTNSILNYSNIFTQEIADSNSYKNYENKPNKDFNPPEIILLNVFVCNIFNISIKLFIIQQSLIKPSLQFLNERFLLSLLFILLASREYFTHYFMNSEFRECFL